jgi:hypothetical protein
VSLKIDSVDYAPDGRVRSARFVEDCEAGPRERAAGGHQTAAESAREVRAAFAELRRRVEQRRRDLELAEDLARWGR